MSAHRAWHFHRLFLAPHRLAFASAALLLVVSSVWWAIVNLATSMGHAPQADLPAGVTHSLVMTFGFMPLFFVGFLFTAGPKWLRMPPVEARSLMPGLAPQVAGWLLFLPALHASDPAFTQTMGAIGLVAVTVGWAVSLARFVAMLVASRADDTVHAWLVALGGSLGAVALGLAAWGVAGRDTALVRVAVQLGLWGFIGVVFAVVAHRMIPCFSSAALPALDAWRPQWLLWVFVGVFAVRTLAACAEALAFTDHPAWPMGLALVELPPGVACIALAVRWGLVQSLRIRLLAMLHLGFTWLGVSLVLFGVAHAVEAAGGPASLFGLAPLHAFTMGYLASTMLAMVTRVSCGHGGRTLAADDFIWRLFWLLQLATLARLLAAVLMPAGGRWGVVLVLAAALGWAVVCAGWGLRYGRWYGTPRLDGRPG